MQADEARELAIARECVFSVQPLDGRWLNEYLEVIARQVADLLAHHALEARKAALEEAAQVAEVTWLNSFGPINKKIKRVFEAIRSLAERASGEAK